MSHIENTTQMTNSSTTY